MKRINLLPKSEQQEFRLQLFSKQLLAFLAWVITSLVIFLGIAIGARVLLEQQVKDVDQQIGLDKQILKTSDNERLKSEVTDLNNQILGIKNLASQHYFWSSALAELAKIFPADMQIDLISLDRSSGQVDVQGTAGRRDSVLKFWSDLHKSEYFTNINFPLPNLNQATNDPFTFTFFLNPEKIKQP